MFNNLSETYQIILSTCYLSENAFSLDKSNILPFGKGLTLSKTINFRLFQTERVCR